MAITRLERETRRYSTTRLERRLQGRDNRPPLAAKIEVKANINVDQTVTFQELRSATSEAINDLVYQFNQALSRITKYQDEDGRIVKYGLADGCVIGRTVSDKVVDELQTMGSTLTDAQWEALD